MYACESMCIGSSYSVGMLGIVSILNIESRVSIAGAHSIVHPVSHQLTEAVGLINSPRN